MSGVDKLIVSRIDLVLNDLGKTVEEIDSEHLLEILQDRYPDLARKKFGPLRKSIILAMKLIRKRERLSSSSSSHNSSSVVNDQLSLLYGPPGKVDIRKSSIDNQSGTNNAILNQSSDALNTTVSVEEKANRKRRKYNLYQSQKMFADFSGYPKILSEVSRFILHAKTKEIFRSFRIASPIGLLLSGPCGCGKSFLVEVISGEFDIPLMKVGCSDLISELSGNTENRIRDMFTFCRENSPCILFLDDVDCLLQKRESASKQMEQRIISEFARCLDDLNANESDSLCIVIASTSNPDTMDSSLRRTGRFDREISIGMPDLLSRAAILKTITNNVPLDETFSFEALAELTPGFVAADLVALVREAAMSSITSQLTADHLEHISGELGIEYNILKSNNQPSNPQFSPLKMEDFVSALKIVQPSAKREGFITVPSVTWKDIGALEDVRKELKLAIVYPVRHWRLFTAFNLTYPPGILLAGPPGCGKTMLAKAVANEAGINFISVKGPELLNMYLGESERAVRQVFSRAKSSAPCVIFFDEIDALCPKRSSRSEGSGAKVVQQFLTELDGVESRGGVFILAATNRPDVIDTALLRPGRFDKVLHVSLPSENERLDILRAITSDGSRPKIDGDCSLEYLASHPSAECFSGADLACLVREASINALQTILEQSSPSAINEMTQQDCIVKKKNFDAAFSKLNPSVKEDYLYERR